MSNAEALTQGGPRSIAIRFENVTWERGGRRILHGIDWEVRSGEQWVVLGRNGSGKTSMLRLIALYDHPSTGTVAVLGSSFGTTDIREHRRKIALLSPAMGDMLRPQLTALETVVTARFGALEPWWHTYEEADWQRARSCLAEVGLGDREQQALSHLSSGERQRVLLARALMADAPLILLDEPTAGLDLGGREELIERIDRVAESGRTQLLITHHVEEIPASFTHLLGLREGQIIAAGPIEETLTDEFASALFGLPITVERNEGRFSARLRRVSN